MATIKRYGNGSTASAFYRDGQGMVYYPSGSVAIAVTCPRGGGLSHNFYLDGSSRGGTSKAGRIAASFDSEGCGFVVWPESGSPMLSITKQGGRLTDREGVLQREWLWQTQLERLKFGREPIEVRINNAMSLVCKSRNDIKVKYVLFVEMTFQVGLPSKKGLTADTAKASSAHGPRGHHNETILEKTQRLNYSLPRLSASGRETVVVLKKPPKELKRGIGDIVATTDALMDRLKSDAMKSSITKRSEHAGEAGDRIWRDRAAGVRRSRPKKFGADYISEYRVKASMKDPLLSMRILSPKQLLDAVEASEPSRLLFCVCTSRKYSESRPAVKKSRWVATQVLKHWEKNACNGVKFSFYECDCSRTKNALQKRFNLTSYPVWLWWYGGKLVFAGGLFENCGSGQKDIEAHLRTVAGEPESHFKREGWKFVSY